VRPAWIVLGALGALGATACGDDGGAAGDARGDIASEVTPDVVTGELAFRAPAADGEAIVVELVALDATRLVIEVVARGLRPDDQVMAVGVRLRYDPAALAFVSAAPGERWSAGVTLASGATPGVVVLGVAHPHPFYEDPQAPAGDQVIYRVTFDVRAALPTPLELVARRSRVAVWPSGADPERVIAPRFVGAELVVTP